MRHIEFIEDNDALLEFRTSCMCKEVTHSITVSFYKKYGTVFLYLYNWWIDGLNVDYNLPSIIWHLKCWWERIKLAWHILFYGEYKFLGEFLFGSPEHLKDFINALATIYVEWENKKKREVYDGKE